MSDPSSLPVKPHIQQRAHIRSMEEYERLYRLSLDNPEWFWAEQQGRDHWLDEECARQRSTCTVEWMGAEDPLFVLYTSGSTGKPKGVLHTTGGYMVYAAFTHKIVFDYHPGDIYCCAADVGWVTGHTYIVYGPLANGARRSARTRVCTRPRTSLGKNDRGK